MAASTPNTSNPNSAAARLGLTVPRIPANSPLLSSTATLTGTPLQQAAQALAIGQVAGPISQLNQQVKNTTQQARAAERLTAGYYRGFGQQAAQGLQDARAIGTRQNEQLAGLTGDVAQALQDTGSDAMAQYQKYVPGSATDPSLAAPGFQSLSSEIARQQGLSAQTMGAFQAAGANQAKNYSDYAASMLGTGALAGREQLGSIARAGVLANQGALGQIAGLRSQFGSDYINALNAIRQQGITNAFTRQGLGNQQQSIRNQLTLGLTGIAAANQRANQALTASNNRTKWIISAENDRNQASINARQMLADSNNAARAALAKAKKSGGTSGTSGPTTSPLTRLEQNRYYNIITGLQTVIKTKAAWIDKKGNPIPTGTLYQHLTSGDNKYGTPFTRVFIDAAYQLNKLGYIRLATAHLLQAIGFQPGHYQFPIGPGTGAAPGATYGPPPGHGSTPGSPNA